ncbi:MAG: TolC family protein [Burkholderiaceae bacterium]|nr:TolC family protein [Burkholderiaceae bacterium]
MRHPHHTTSMKLTALALALALAGCAVGPHYDKPPTVDTPTAFKEGQGEWVRAAPADTLERGPWWQLFNDPVLSDLASRVEVSNQTVAAAVAAYAQARALVAQQRASLLPVVTLDGGANRNGGRGGTPERNSFSVSLGASWEPDIFGNLARGVQGARAGEQASASDLAAARLAMQGELAVNYFNLREQDAERALLMQTITGYERTLQITNNRYQAAIAAKTDVLQAETQLANSRADLLGLERTRAQLEHAIAVLVGQAPANFTLAPRVLTMAGVTVSAPPAVYVSPSGNAPPTVNPSSAMTAAATQVVVPDVPLEVPSVLLQRRPDIAAAERRVAQANEQIGIAQSAYYPSLRLSGSAGLGAARIGDLFSASSLVWALGPSAAQTLFSGGLRGAQVDSARAGFDRAVANYRQTVLTAFQDVENQLVASRVLGQQLALRQQASRAADQVEEQVLNRYKAGQVSYTDVITAQVTAQNARRALVQLQSSRQVASVTLIQALGGGWRGL